MLIANPIYDTVFKYMMENIDIAKGVISTIIDQTSVIVNGKLVHAQRTRIAAKIIAQFRLEKTHDTIYS